MSEESSTALIESAEPQAETNAGTEAKKENKKVKARVLQDCQFGRANDLVHLTEADARAAAKSGLIDTHKAAVDYAASLEQNQ